jgi:hypothetical protein
MNEISIKERLEKSVAKFQIVEKRIEAIPKETEANEKKITERTADLNGILESIEVGRKQRQKLLVSGGKVEEATRKIREFWEKCDLLEDEILGLKEKGKDLHAEKEDLLKEKDTVRDEIIKIRLIPLKEKYNKNAEMASDALKGILSIMDEYGLPFGDSQKEWGRFISTSSWIGLRIVPRLSQTNDKPEEDFFNITEITLKRQREQREEAYKLSQHTPDPEA